MAVIRDDDFVSRAEGEWRNSTERIIAIIYRILYFLYDNEEKLKNKSHYQTNRNRRFTIITLNTICNWIRKIIPFSRIL
jgi:hypothetical protein